MEVKCFSCDSQGMAEAQTFLESVCPAPKPGIIMDEIVSNIVRCSGANQFEIGLEKADDGLTMVFSDDGKSFDPTTEVEDPNVDAPVEERSVGGLGIFMVKKMSKSVKYVRQDGKNVLTVKL